MDETMRASEAIFGGGPSGRFWYREANASPDALKTLTMLLTILSKSDAPLSQVVDELTMTQ
jgi:phosphomannomutase